MKLLLHSVCKTEKSEDETNTKSVCKPLSYIYISACNYSLPIRNNSYFLIFFINGNISNKVVKEPGELILSID